MSDVLPEAASGMLSHTLEQDFVRAPKTILDISTPGARTSQEGLVKLVDSGSDIPIGLTMYQRSLVEDMMDYEDIIIMRYAIHNSSGRR